MSIGRAKKVSTDKLWYFFHAEMLWVLWHNFTHNLLIWLAVNMEWWYFQWPWRYIVGDYVWPLNASRGFTSISRDCFVCDALRPACYSFEGVIVWISSESRFTGRFWCAFHRLFIYCFFSLRNDSTFRGRYAVLIFAARWSHNFREITVRNSEKSKIVVC